MRENRLFMVVFPHFTSPFCTHLTACGHIASFHIIYCIIGTWLNNEICGMTFSESAGPAQSLRSDFHYDDQRGRKTSLS